MAQYMHPRRNNHHHSQRSRSRSRTRHQPSKLGIIREKTCPLLLRVFIKENDSFSEEDFRFQRDEIQPDEIQIYTWKDATLEEIMSLIRGVNLLSREPGCRLVFSFGYPGKDGVNVVKTVGVTYSS